MLIETEFLKSAFESIVGLVLKTGRAVPVPSLTPLGNDRLILSFLWTGNPSVEPGFPGYVPPPGTLLLKSSVVLTHASIAEIKLQFNTPGVSVTGTAWVLATATPDRVVLNLVGFDTGTGPTTLAYPPELGTLPLPAPDGVKIEVAALVSDNSVAVLRLATSALDNTLQPSANRLLAARAKPQSGMPNWLIHVPGDVFVYMILDLLTEAVSPPPDGMIVEEAPTASWGKFSILPWPAPWGVQASMGLEKLDACPGLFEDTDVSVDIGILANFEANVAQKQIDIELTIATDASDWDTFRCWLGSAGFGSLALNLVIPFVGVPAAIGSLVTVGELVRKRVGDALSLVSVKKFSEVSRSASSVTYSGSFPVYPIPLSTGVTFALGPTGLEIQGAVNPIPPAHAPSFNPDLGPLSGAWTSKVNCSARAMTHAFTFQDVLVADALVLGLGVGQVGRVPVTIYSSSVIEPAGKCWIKTLGGQPNLSVRIEAPGLHPGETGFAVLHTSAGLRAYDLGPLPAIPSLTLGMQDVIDAFCDSLTVPRLLIDIDEVRWVEPPPGYGWGHEPLRQWQLVVQGLSENAAIEVRAISSNGPLLASRQDFMFSAGRAVLELVTDAKTDLVLRAPGAGAEAKVSLTTRWLLPQHRETFDAPVLAFSRVGSMLRLSTDRGERTFDLDMWTSNTVPRESTSRTRVFNRQGQSLSLRSGRVALIHDGDLVIARSINTLVREKIYAADNVLRSRR